jgi:copper resistance protein D
MEWFEAGLNAPLIAVRAIHFAATAITTGSLIFRAVVLEPALASGQQLPCSSQMTNSLRAQIARLTWIGLGVTVFSGVIWVLVEAASMSGVPLGEAMNSGVLQTVLQETQFGQVCEIRFVFSLILAACLAWHRFAFANWFAFASGLAIAAGIAWTGHAGSTPGELGDMHVAGDALHLLAAAAWVGGLLPLALMLAAAAKETSLAFPSLASNVTRRFSALGLISVAALAATGIINAWILVGSIQALVSTGYGRLLVLKLVVFVLMLMFAAYNRYWLTPRLAYSSDNNLMVPTLHQLTRNSVIEIALGFAIFAIVGMLGTMHPAIHLL